MSNTQGKEHLTIRLPAGLRSYVRAQPNMSRYIENLVKRDMQKEREEDIYTAIRDRLMRDAEFVDAMQPTHTAPSSPTRSKSDIKSEIYDLEAEAEEKATHAQDPDELQRINREYKATIDSLWAEYHAS